jgi:acetyl esterase/lipase
VNIATPGMAGGQALARRDLHRLGRALGVESLQGTRAMFAPLQAPLDGAIRVDPDQAYGVHPRQCLDLFMPQQAPMSEAYPVLVFVHGGGFSSGDRRVEGTPFFQNVGLWAARNGWLGITMSYRLAPEFKWPCGADDVALAVQWIRRNIASRGGNPERIVLMGHSAGAAHVASFVARSLDRRHDGVRAALLLSGLYAPSTMPPAPWLAGYYGNSPGAEHSTVAALATAAIPLTLSVAEFDPPEFVDQCALLDSALRGAGQGPAEILRLQGHNHYSSVLHFNAEDSPLTVHLRRLAGLSANS